MASSSSKSNCSSTCVKRSSSSRIVITYDANGRPICACGFSTVEMSEKTPKKLGRMYWGCTNYKDDLDRGCGFCLFVDESPFMPPADRVPDEETLAMYDKLKGKEDEIRNLLIVKARVECVIEYKNDKIIMLAVRSRMLLWCFVMDVVVIGYLLMYS